MKKLTILTLAGLLTLAFGTIAFAHMGGWGHMGYNGDHRYDDRGMHRDYDSRYGSATGRAYCWNYPAEGEAIDSADEARAEVEGYLKSLRNPNLKAGEVTEQEKIFEVDILTKDGSLADKILVEKRTGRLMPAYR